MPSTRRVLVVQGSSQIGGTELQSFKLATWLCERGFEVVTLFDCPAGPVVDLYREAGLPFRVQAGGAWPSMALRTWLREIAPRTALLYGLKVNLRWRVLLRLFFPQVRRWGTIRGLTNGSRVAWYRIALDRITLPLLEGYVHNSLFVGDYLVRRGFPRAKLHYLKNFVPSDAVREESSPLPLPRVVCGSGSVTIPGDVPIITYVANVRTVKGHIHLLRALALLKKQGSAFRCLLVGAVSEREVPALAQRLHLEDEVVFTGLRSDVTAILARSDIFVFPSLMEGCPNGVLEAMRMGLPIIASPWGDQGWLVEEGAGGFVVDPRNTAAFADRIAHLIENPDVRRRFGLRNRERLAETFAAADVAGTALRLFTLMTD